MNSIKKQFLTFCSRWLFNSIALYLMDKFLAGVSLDGDAAVVFTAGLIITLVNAVVRPVIVMIALPAFLISFGLVIALVNGLLVILTDWLYTGFTVNGWLEAIMVGLLVGLLNYLISFMIYDDN